MGTMDQERLEEALELLWVLEEEEKGGLKRLKGCSDDEGIEKTIAELERRGFITVDGEDVRFTPEGKEIARGVVRRHRLAERLFADVFEMKEEYIHEDACKMEHILSKELTDSVCTFLGHPPTCPHDKPIPRGECCKKYRLDVEPLVARLADFEVGQKGRIVYIVPSDPSRLNRLNSIGINAGSTLKLLQKWPSVVVQVDETTVAIDIDIAKEIFVKKSA
ncbi:MAG TPA: DtxR family transcriptional regulator [Nitrospirae bacterium]|nr:DtxR family transcriptional regulator [Nitrospirota bacterium]